ncbi:MAG: GNAT family N-acetyltransferase [Lachnospiraceae bacterium]|nr:GNAT family N-acetyltransferase [Lachnospiraceae bacterium]MDD3795325.1 GNAT family N-acetyltransferase [Lachnospiraceae bacterium]
MKFNITDNITEHDRTKIFQGLLEYNLVRIEDQKPKDLGIYFEDPNGHKLAGLIGETHGNWLTIKYLWVSEMLRNQHIGSSILKQAEKTAKERGCKYVFLDTFDFQAPEFYKKHGYKEIFTLNEYPCTGKRYYFTKNL